MGTNFYWLSNRGGWLPNGQRNSTDQWCSETQRHIGKRSAAGLYCWDCGVTLCKAGPDHIHEGPRPLRHDAQGFIDMRDYAAKSVLLWWDKCPKCGQGKVDELPFEAGPVALELGFAPPRPAHPTGVRGCSSFSWDQAPELVRQVCTAKAGQQILRDEYDRILTGQQFLDMLAANCPIEYTDSIGRHFS